MTKKRTTEEPPTFSSIDEAADWHDSHDVADLDEHSEEVTSPFANSAGLSQVFSVRFDADTVTRLAAAATRRQVGVTQVVRSWVLERLSADEAGNTATWTTGLTDDALAEIRSVVERTIATAAYGQP
jgi:hypothetical protein